MSILEQPTLFGFKYFTHPVIKSGTKNSGILENDPSIKGTYFLFPSKQTFGYIR
jgi:hypothetical protein